MAVRLAPRVGHVLLAATFRFQPLQIIGHGIGNGLAAGEWPRPGKSYSLIRYSQLDQNNVSTAGGLQQAWSYSTGVLRGHEEAPIVVNGTMYVVTPYPNELHALDISRSGAARWVYRP